MRYIINVITIFSVFISLNAQQTNTPEENFDDAQFFFVRKDYKEALYFFKQLLASFPENANYNFKVGECYLNIPGQEHLAVPFFEKASQRIVPKKEYRGKSFNEGNAPLHVLFYLGNAYRMAGLLDSALNVYASFKESPHFIYNYNEGVVESEIESCRTAKNIFDAPIDYEKELLPEIINSGYSEYNPIISKEGKHMVFVRSLKFYEAIYYTTLVDGKWSDPLNLNPEIGSDGNYFPTGISSDGKTILFTSEKDGNYNIYVSKHNGENWSMLRELPGKINSKANESYATFGTDERTIYLVTDRQGGFGGKDIWTSWLLEDGEWSRPRNPGKVINTEKDEDTPSLCSSGNTLFFSSQGHYNMGGFDIFYSNRINNEWDIPQNLGYPINTTRDDLFYQVAPENCKKGIYSIIDSKSGVSDVFTITVKTPLVKP